MSVKILTIVVLLFFVSCWSPAETRSETGKPCCLDAGPYIQEKIIECIKQKPMKGCRSNNYVVKVNSGEWYCIRADSRWMKNQIDEGKVSCITYE